MRRKRVHLYKKTGSYVLCMAKVLEINEASFEGVVINLKMGVRQLQAKYLARKKNLYFAFKDLERVFDRFPRVVDCFGETTSKRVTVKTAQSMYKNV